jgi:hypothetical protein
VHQLSRDEEEDGLYELLIASGLMLALVLFGVTLKLFRPSLISCDGTALSW